MEEIATDIHPSNQDKTNDCFKLLFQENGILRHILTAVSEERLSAFLDEFIENERVRVAITNFVKEIEVELRIALRPPPDTNVNAMNDSDNSVSRSVVKTPSGNTILVDNSDIRDVTYPVLGEAPENDAPGADLPQSTSMNEQEDSLACSVAPAATPAPESTTRQQLQPGVTPANTSSAPKPALVPELSKTSFSMSANGRVNEEYRGKIQGINKSGKNILIKQVDIPAGAGLSFDPETCEIFGAPTRAGEFELKVHFQFAPFSPADPTPVGTCQLIVNPDPKTLWKNLESDGNDKYWKPDTDMIFVPGNDGLAMIVASKRGRSHAHAGTFRDDDFKVDHDIATGWRIMAVADGGGNAKKSRRGSQIASRVANESVLTALKGERGSKLEAALAAFDADTSKPQRPVMEELYYLFGNAAREVVHAIAAEATADVAPYKDFSTTLIITIHKKFEFGHFVAAYWVGDGGAGAYHAGEELNVLGKADSGEFAGQTRFLDSSMVDPKEIMSRIRFSVVKDFSAILAMTDGITDPKFETDANFENSQMWDALWSELEPITFTDNPGQALLDWLDFWSAGNHDDRTIAILCPLKHGTDH